MQLRTTLFATALALAASVAAAAPQTRNHTGGGTTDPREVARASYRAADDAEAMSRDANWSCRNGQGYQLGASANRLHLALSDLYRAALRASTGNPLSRHHNDSPFGEDFELVEQSYSQLQMDFSTVGFSCGTEVQRLYQSLQYDYSYLGQLFAGGDEPGGGPGGPGGEPGGGGGPGGEPGGSGGGPGGEPGGSGGPHRP